MDSEGGHRAHATRAQQWDNQRLVVHQVVRLLTAGAKIDDLDVSEILRLLKLRGERRGGLSRATFYRWNAAATKGTLTSAVLLDWLTVHEPYAVGMSRLTRAAYEQDTYKLPMTLWVASSAETIDVLIAELEVLVRAQRRGGSSHLAQRAAEFLAFIQVLERATTGDVATESFPGVARFLFEMKDNPERWDGISVKHVGWEDVREIVEYRQHTARLAWSLNTTDSAQRDEALRALRGQPVDMERYLLNTTHSGRAAVVERALLLADELDELQGKHPARSSGAVARVRAVLREEIPQLRTPEGLFSDSNAGSSWSESEWDLLSLRAFTWRVMHDTSAPQTSPWPASDLPDEISYRRSLLAALRPAALEALIRHERSLPTTAPKPLLDTLGSDSTRTWSWAVPPRHRDRWMAAYQDVMAQLPTETALGRTTVRNLRDLERALQMGAVVRGETRRELMQAMQLLQHELAKP